MFRAREKFWKTSRGMNPSRKLVLTSTKRTLDRGAQTSKPDRTCPIWGGNTAQHICRRIHPC